MKFIRANRLAFGLLLLSFAYYSILSAKTYTWLFTSGDSGDWLASSTIWMVPQPFGSPLYIVLGHFLNLFPFSLEVKMTILLSALPSAITVMLVYLIANILIGNAGTLIQRMAVPLILLGAGLFLSQSTILEEYALTTMFLVASFYFYLRASNKLSVICLGLAAAIHVIMIPIALLWFLLQWRNWARYIPLYIVCGILPYGLILYLMAASDYPYLAGGLSWGAINSYLGSTGVAGSISLVETPRRLLELGSILLLSLGLALIPAIYGAFKPWSIPLKMIVVVVGFSIWYYATSLDPTTWTFLTFSIPFMAILAGLGLSKLKPVHANLVIAGALVLVLTNGIFLNASTLHAENPVATEYYESLQAIPDGSAVVTHRGGFEGLGLFYVLSQGKDLTPIFFKYEDKQDVLWENYLEWTPLEGSTTQELVDSALLQDMEVYCLVPLLEPWEPAFELDYPACSASPDYCSYFRKVIAVNKTEVYSPNYIEEE